MPPKRAVGDERDPLLHAMIDNAVFERRELERAELDLNRRDGRHRTRGLELFEIDVTKPDLTDLAFILKRFERPEARL